MRCGRCHAESTRKWCATCEGAFDVWVRRYASDMIVPLVAGSLVVVTFAMGLPLLGVGWLVGGAGAVLGFGMLGAFAQLTRARRRRQFLDAMPRAALMPAKQ